MEKAHDARDLTAGQVAFARSVSAGRTVMALVAAVASATASTWREPLPLDIAGLVIGASVLVLGREVVRWLKRAADHPDPAMIVADAALAVALLGVVGGEAGPIGWIAMALPVLEALVWSGVIAAALTWMSVGGTFVVLRTMVGVDVDVVLRDLLAHIGGSLLIAIPAWAAGSVIGRELNSADRTRSAAEGRADQIERLAGIGRRLAGAESTDDVLDLLARAGFDLGFDAADVVSVAPDGVRTIERMVGEFNHGPPRIDWLIDQTVDRGVAATNPVEDVQALHRCGLRSGVAARVTEHRRTIIVRLWRRQAPAEGVDDREMARTLAAQAAVAWHQASVRDELHGRAIALEHEATHDALTGLANRNGLLAHLDSVGYDMSGRLALLYIDLDGFKQVNDTLGHDVGDEVLRVAAQRLLASVGGGFVSRLGGDEFVIAVGVSTIEQAAAIGNRVIAALEAPIESAHNSNISGSVGVTLVARQADVHEMMRAADQSMYAAKRAGGGRVAAARSGPVAPAASSEMPVAAVLDR